MAVVSSTTIIRSLALFHITLAYFFLTNPKLIASQNVVFLLGESMQLPSANDFYKPSAACAFIAVLLAFFGLSDLTATSLPDDIANTYWGTQTPVRLTFLFGLIGYTYVSKEGGVFAKRERGYRFQSGNGLKNSLVFTWGFLELSLWFWVFLTLRDERRQRAQKLIDRRKAELSHL